MSALYANGFPTPRPIDHSRHIVVMSRIKGSPISQIRSGRMTDPQTVFLQSIALLSKLASHGLIHCDFNEFNLMLTEESNTLILIDFPQMVSTSHPNAEDLFERDLNGIVKFFATKMRFTPAIDVLPSFAGIIASEELTNNFTSVLSNLLQESGFSSLDNELLVSYITNNSAAQYENEDDMEEESASGVLSSEVELDSSGCIVQDNIQIDQPFVSSSTEAADAPLVEGEEEEGAGEELEVEIEEHADAARARSIREKVFQSRKGVENMSRKGSRNATKKRNKYGRVVKISVDF